MIRRSDVEVIQFPLSSAWLPRSSYGDSILSSGHTRIITWYIIIGTFILLEIWSMIHPYVRLLVITPISSFASITDRPHLPNRHIFIDWRYKPTNKWFTSCVVGTWPTKPKKNPKTAFFLFLYSKAVRVFFGRGGRLSRGVPGRLRLQTLKRRVPPAHANSTEILRGGALIPPPRAECYQGCGEKPIISRGFPYYIMISV